eukprot:5169193-Alexandrium_andersonii.AAC.1
MDQRAAQGSATPRCRSTSGGGGATRHATSKGPVPPRACTHARTLLVRSGRTSSATDRTKRAQAHWAS